MLPKGSIEDMRSFSRAQPALFEAYAIRDAEIAALFSSRLMSLFGEIGALGRGGRPPATIGAASVNLLRSIADRRGLDLDGFLGYGGRGRGRALLPAVGDHLTTYAECFHGGRNEAFWLGYSPRGAIYDLDLSSAYLTAMSQLREPAWQLTEVTRDINALLAEGLGFARVRFEFPARTPFPCLPVRGGERGLIFPLSGVSWCTAAELALARELDARLTIEHGVFVPWASEMRPLEAFATEVKALRDRHAKGSLFELMIKTSGNALYGKLAQSVSGWRPSGQGDRMVFDARSGQMQPLPPSRITSAPIAAVVTGMVRAAIGAILAGIPRRMRSSRRPRTAF